MRRAGVLVTAILLAGCAETRVVTKTEIVKVTIPQELLECQALKRPRIKNSNSVIVAYSEAFVAWKSCKRKLAAVAELNANSTAN